MGSLSASRLSGSNLFLLNHGQTGSNPKVRLADYPSRIAVYAQNSSRAWKAIMRGLLSPPSPTPSNPVGGEVVYASAPNPLCVEGFPGIPACTMLGSAKFGWLKTLKN